MLGTTTGSTSSAGGGLASATMRSGGPLSGTGVLSPKLVTQALGPAAALNPLVEARSPGPIYLPRFDATMPKDPIVLFPAAPRDPPAPKGGATPGPGAYGLPPEDRGQAVSIRGREKFGSATLSSAAAVPGPGSYPRLETVATRDRNPPRYSLKGRRVERPPAFAVPAPNAHQHPEPFNKRQFVAKLHNAPAVRMGPPPKSRKPRALSASAVLASATAAAAGGAGGDKDKEKGEKEESGAGAAAGAGGAAGGAGAGAAAGGAGKASALAGGGMALAALAHATPGPSEYTVEPGFAHLSTLPRVPAFSMVPRRPMLRKAGSHIAPELHAPVQGIGKQPESHKRTAPAVSFSGRVKFGSPYA